MKKLMVFFLIVSWLSLEAMETPPRCIAACRVRAPRLTVFEDFQQKEYWLEDDPRYGVIICSQVQLVEKPSWLYYAPIRCVPGRQLNTNDSTLVTNGTACWYDKNGTVVCQTKQGVYIVFSKVAQKTNPPNPNAIIGTYQENNQTNFVVADARR